MSPQQRRDGTTAANNTNEMNHQEHQHQLQEQQHIDDAEHSTSDHHFTSSSSSQCTPQELFRYIDQQHANVTLQLQECDTKRTEVVREMAEHMLSFQTSSSSASDGHDDDDSIFHRHTELTLQLSSLQKLQQKLQTKLASVNFLSEKRRDVEAMMRRRLKLIHNGSGGGSAAAGSAASSFSLDELCQIIESQASATLEVELLHQERNLLAIQLEEAERQRERLQLQCAEKDERILVLKQQNASLQQELAHFHAESPMSSQVSAAEMSQISCLRSNLEAESAHIRHKRLTIKTSNHSHSHSHHNNSIYHGTNYNNINNNNNNNLHNHNKHYHPMEFLLSPMTARTAQSTMASLSSSSSTRPRTPPSTVEIQNDTTPLMNNLHNASMTTTTAAAAADYHRKQADQKEQAALALDIQGNLRGDSRATDEEVRIKEEEKKLRQKAQHLKDEAIKEEERKRRDQMLQQQQQQAQQQEAQLHRSMEQKQQKRQQDQREKWAKEEAAKDEERRIRQTQERQQMALQEQQQQQESSSSSMMSPLSPTDSKKAGRMARKLLSPIPEAKRIQQQSQQQQQQHPRQHRMSLEAVYQRQARRQAERQAANSIRNSTITGTPPSASLRSHSAHHQRNNHDAGRDAQLKANSLHGRSTHGGMPGAMRVTASGQLQTSSSSSDDNDDDNSSQDSFGNDENDDHYSFGDDDSNGAIATLHSMDGISPPFNSAEFAVEATLVRNTSGVGISNVSERERWFEERERELEAREAAVAQQARSLQDLTLTASAEVTTVAAATAIATISKEGSIRSLTRPNSPKRQGGRGGTMGLSTSMRGMGLSTSFRNMNQSFRANSAGEEVGVPDLDEGPLRFHPMDERPLRNQFLDISDKDYECFQKLQTRWETKRKDKGGAPYSESLILRFLRNNTHKDGSFNLNKAWKAMKKCKEKNLFLSAAKLQHQLLTATLFPVPGLLSNAGFEMFYMKPCRYHRRDSVKDVIDNLVYVMNTMLEKETNSRNGIGFLACMNDWKMVNFDVNYCYQFMMALQALVVPVTVELFLIVNPPIWFGGIWKIMKPMLAPSFRKKVKVIKESMLDKYLMEGYQQYLPDDLSTGTVDTFQLAQDFVTYRKYMELGNVQLNAKSAIAEEDESSQFSHSTDKSAGSRLHHAYAGRTARTFSSNDTTSSEGKLGSQFGGSSSAEAENDNDDASIHCSIDGVDDDNDDNELAEELDVAEAAVGGSTYSSGDESLAMI